MRGTDGDRNVSEELSRKCPLVKCILNTAKRRGARYELSIVTACNLMR